MPIYEYQCQKCHHHLEALQKISDKPLRECPECGRHTLKRLLSAPLFRLAGSGWYETDFKSDAERKRNLVEKGEGAAEAKPETETAKPAEAAATSKDAKPASTESKPTTAQPATAGKTAKPASPARKPARTVSKATRKR